MFVKGIIPLLVCLLAGCGSKTPLEQMVEQKFPIDPSATISIRNGDGSIRVYGGVDPELQVCAIKKAYTQSRLDQIAIDISHQAGSASIGTRFPPKPVWALSDRSGTVDYIIVVPQGARIAQLDLANGEVHIDGLGAPVQARLGNGLFFVRNCFCDLNIAIEQGGFSLLYEWWDAARFSVDARVANGKASAFIPGGASFHLLAETTRGEIFSDFAREQQRLDTSVRKIDAVIGTTPAAEVRIRTTRGDIKIMEQNP